MTKIEFIQYFLSFYGQGGLYPMEGLTVRQIEMGIELRGQSFEGDSFDREAIRDIILVATNRLGGVLEIGMVAPQIEPTKIVVR